MGKEEKSFKNYLWIITLVVGLALGTFGVTRIVAANNMNVPAMGEPGWFDAENARTQLKMLGIALTCFGYLMIGLGGSLFLYFFINGDRIVEENIIPSINEMVNNNSNQTEQHRVCQYCGAELGESNTCSSCGAKNQAKK